MNDVSLRPLGFGEILDRAFAMYRNNFAGYFTTALLPFLPMVALWLVLGALAPAAGDLSAAASMVQLILVPYSVAATLLAWGAITYQADRKYHGGSASLGESYSAAARRFFPLLVSMFVAWLLMMIGFVLLVIPGILIGIMLFALIPAIQLENRGPIEALGRSRALARGAWGRIFGVVVVVTIITGLPHIALSVAALFGIAAMDVTTIATGGALPFALTQASSAVLSAATLPLTAVTILVLYYDRRVRLEGLDLELATERLGSPA